MSTHKHRFEHNAHLFTVRSPFTRISIHLNDNQMLAYANDPFNEYSISIDFSFAAAVVVVVVLVYFVDC